VSGSPNTRQTAARIVVALTFPVCRSMRGHHIGRHQHGQIRAKASISAFSTTSPNAGWIQYWPSATASAVWSN
jgi:hypothetical protein